LRIFEPVYQNAENILFTGEHTRNIFIPKMATTSGLGKFAVVKKTCLGCKNVLAKETEVLCDKCKPKKKMIYIERKQELCLFEKNYADLWVQC
jgi:DNA polymerase delta subunit 1